MALWVALRRSRRDPRARLNLLRLLLFLAYLIAIVVFYSNLFLGLSLDFGRIGNLIVWGIIPFFLLIFILVGILQRRLERRAQDRDNPAVPATTKLAIYREACLLAILLERLSSEIGMEKELPEDIEVITRRVLLDRLAELNLRDNLEPELRDILLAPDGHWPQELKQRAFQSWECFTVLRWVLGLGALTPLTEQPNYKLADINVLFAIKQLEKLSVLPAWDVRPLATTPCSFSIAAGPNLSLAAPLGMSRKKLFNMPLKHARQFSPKGTMPIFLLVCAPYLNCRISCCGRSQCAPITECKCLLF